MDTVTSRQHGHLSASAQIALIEGNLFGMCRMFGAWPRCEVHDDSEMLWSISDIPFPVFNSVMRARLPSRRADAAIEEALERYRARGVPVLWCTGPGTRPQDFPTRLSSRGFDHEWCPGMAMPLRSLSAAAPLPQGLVVERVTDRESLGEWCAVLCAAFELPSFVEEAFADLFFTLGLGSTAPLRHYLGRLDGEPVATCSLCLGAAAGLYNIAILPQARRKGVGSAMVLTPLRDASALGYQMAVVQSLEDAVPFYGRMGFKQMCLIGQFVWAGG